ncbi:transcriptional adapter 2-beta-like isoform X3 [Oratosquilla oratoria]|uniref:transcriptional adapter 2-beta-like isoform X3 n=1 Tax=Oratosquilla oratoria TaxID=337810 RepID=UPI003F76F435
MADTFAKYHCNYCEEDINGLRVRCLECEDFDLCLQCFACGAEIGKHKNNHGYQYMAYPRSMTCPNDIRLSNECAGVFQDTGNFSIIPGQGHWSAREEVRLLDAIEQYGFGNWEDIARYIETRTPEEARHKYISSYIEGNVGKATWKQAAENLKMPIEHSNTDQGPLSPTLGSSLPFQPLPPEETGPLGYMPHRDDFEREWDNEAESIVAPLFLHPTDDEDIDIALKLAQVDMYMRRLRERARRKRVVRDFQVVQKFYSKEKEKSQVPQKKKGRDERDVLEEKLRIISQFQTASEHQNLISSLARERELKVRIRELTRYRRNGIRHVEECREFEIARARRDKKKENKKKGVATNSIPTKAENASLPPTPMTQVDHPARLKENDVKSPKCLVERKCTPLDIGAGKWPNVNLNGNSDWSSSSNSSNSSVIQLQGNCEDAASVSSLPGFHLLSRQERKLCTSLNVKPSQYIAYKATLLKEEGESRTGNPKLACAPQGLEPHHQHQIVSFMTRAGWISSC